MAVSNPIEYPADFLLSIVIPVFNESRTVSELVSRVQETTVPHEIILVDDGSDDGSAEILTRLAAAPNIQAVTHESNRGKGAAVATGCQHVTGNYLLVQDADLEYDPQDYQQLLQPILNGDADVVYGSRYLGDAAKQDGLWHRLGNRCITWLSNCFTGLRLTDVETCYKVMRTDVALDVLSSLQETGFGIEIEVTAMLARRGSRIVEVPIHYSGRSYAQGKKIGVMDGLRALWCILKYR